MGFVRFFGFPTNRFALKANTTCANKAYVFGRVEYGLWGGNWRLINGVLGFPLDAITTAIARGIRG